MQTSYSTNTQTPCPYSWSWLETCGCRGKTRLTSYTLVHNPELSSSLLPSDYTITSKHTKTVFHLAKIQHKQPNYHTGLLPLHIFLLPDLCSLCILLSNLSKMLWTQKACCCDWTCYGAPECSNRKVIVMSSGNYDHVSAIYGWEYKRRKLAMLFGYVEWCYSLPCLSDSNQS